MITADDVRKALVAQDMLEREVDRIVRQPLPQGRIMEFSPAVSASFVPPELGQKEATWNNTGGDFWMTGLGYQVWGTHGTSTPGTYRLFDQGNGIGRASGGGIQLNGRMFDFVWNMRRRTSQSSYASNSGFMSHAALGNMDRAEPLPFVRRWLIPMGDAVTFTIKPLGYLWDGGVDTVVSESSWRFTVIMLMDGFRTGSR